MEQIEKVSVVKSSASGQQMIARWSWREIRHGQLWPVAAALTLIIACVFALSALAVRVEGVMTAQGRAVMAADLVFVSANPTPSPVLKKAEENSLIQSHQTRFSTMAFSDTSMQLVSVKAIESNYPLRGELILEGQNQSIKNNVSQGDLWLAERLFSLLNVQVGDVVAIGDAELRVSGKIALDPALSFNPFRQMPAVLIHQSDMEKTGAVQLGSRVQYRTFFAGDDTQIKALQKSTELKAGERWIHEDTQGRTADLLHKAKQYLSLTVLMVILMASATLVLTCQHYVAGRMESVAMLKSLGASKTWLKRWLMTQVGLLLGLSATAGLLVGVALEALLRMPLTGILPENLPSFGWQPAILAIVVSVVIAIPALGIPLHRLLSTSANSVLQPQSKRSWDKSVWLVAIPVVFLLGAYGSNIFVWIVLAALLVMFVVLAVIGIGIIKGLSRYTWKAPLKLALSRINRSALVSSLQLSALSSSLMLVAIIWLVRTDLLSDWQQTLPADAPNVFAINIDPQDRDGYLAKLDHEEVNRSEGYPIIRGRLTHINGVDAKEVTEQKNKGSEALSRELNFTWKQEIPEHNVVVEGQWTNQGGVSVEQEVANDLDIKVGDRLSFTVSSQEFHATVNTIRTVEWRNMRPNFYFIFTPDVMASLPSTWLVSFRIDESQVPILNQLGRDFPTVSLMDLRTMGNRIQVLLQQISWSLSVLAGLGVMSGLLLIFTLLRLSLYQRKQEIMLYRTFGASESTISKTLWCEYGVMAVVAGIIAVFGSELSVASLMKWGFEQPVTLHGQLWLLLPVIALLIVYLTLKSIINSLLEPLHK